MITLGLALFDNNRLITLSGGYKNLHYLTQFIVIGQPPGNYCFQEFIVIGQPPGKPVSTPELPGAPVSTNTVQ
jgi:hypothetical protein